MKRARACQSQIKLFRSICGERAVQVSRENVRALAHTFSFLWASVHLLSPKQYKVYDREYRRNLVAATDLMAALQRAQQTQVLDAAQVAHIQWLVVVAQQDHLREIRALAFGVAYNT